MSSAAAFDRPVWWRRPWNRGLHFASRLGWRGAELDAGHLIATARKEARLDDLGGDEFTDALELLLREFREVSGADEAGRQLFFQMVVASLKNRLFITQALTEHPAIAALPIVAPIFILGLPRTGTTLLQGLLAAQPGLRTPLRWETDLTPVPPAVAGKRQVKAQVRYAKAATGFANRLSPGLPLAHPIGAMLPEECNPLLMSSFRALLFTTFFPSVAYHDYLYASRFAHAYEWHRRHLQVLSFAAPPATWVLKAPVHMASLAELLTTYPDARVVFMHRDPLAVLPSMCALTIALRRLVTPVQDGHAIGRELMRNLPRMFAAGHAVRERWPASAPRFIDVRYDDLVARPAATVHAILEHFALPQQGVDAAVARFLADDAKRRRERHAYALDDFGLAREAIRATFAREYTLV
ncbi:MAG: sulfotransferase [Burkholderiales bacterium]|nr:sulfotransferase [Burkholderiales bacterium]